MEGIDPALCLNEQLCDLNWLFTLRRTLCLLSSRILPGCNTHWQVAFIHSLEASRVFRCATTTGLISSLPSAEFVYKNAIVTLCLHFLPPLHNSPFCPKPVICQGMPFRSSLFYLCSKCGTVAINNLQYLLFPRINSFTCYFPRLPTIMVNCR